MILLATACLLDTQFRIYRQYHSWNDTPLNAPCHDPRKGTRFAGSKRRPGRRLAAFATTSIELE